MKGIKHDKSIYLIDGNIIIRTGQLKFRAKKRFGKDKSNIVMFLWKHYCFAILETHLV